MHIIDIGYILIGAGVAAVLLAIIAACAFLIAGVGDGD